MDWCPTTNQSGRRGFGQSGSPIEIWSEVCSINKSGHDESRFTYRGFACIPILRQSSDQAVCGEGQEIVDGSACLKPELVMMIIVFEDLNVSFIGPAKRKGREMGWVVPTVLGG